ncbi:hypothetical protein BC832DRAFT_232986 [Gaertneriomyces semiglobifer]|nr:hypothetical protein BC832DRAFT_232986 [Gaertneriomyces semiglobifer]
MDSAIRSFLNRSHVTQCALAKVLVSKCKQSVNTLTERRTVALAEVQHGRVGDVRVFRLAGGISSVWLRPVIGVPPTRKGPDPAVPQLSQRPPLPTPGSLPPVPPPTRTYRNHARSSSTSTSEDGLAREARQRPRRPRSVAQNVEARQSVEAQQAPSPLRPFVTGPPTRAHWKPDSEASTCDLCGERFGFILRRHHCRRCGGVFCLSCSSHFVRLDQNAQFHPAGVISRVCRSCSDEYDSRLIPLHASVADLDLSDGEEEASGSLAVPIAGAADAQEDSSLSLMSVPSDWQWSTF